MSAYRGSVKCRISYIIAALAAILIFIAAVVSLQLRKHIGEVCEYKGSEIATDIINSAAEGQLVLSEDSEFFSVTRDDNGNILSAEINSPQVNRMRNELVTEVNNRLSTLEDEEVSIPVGTLTGITYLSGRGFDVDMRLHSIGSVKSEIKSAFESAGINQTKFSLYIIITADIKAVMPFETRKITVSQEFLVSEAIIVGEVPQTYLKAE